LIVKQPVHACALAFVLFFLPTSTPLVAAQDTLYQGEETWLIPTFSLTDQKGQAFSSANLQGKVWVAHFFFTTCTGGCTKTAPAMAELQKLVRGKRGIALVSISLNQDAPEDLQQYARGLEADPEQWIFLTGEKAKVHDIVQNFFKEGVQEVDNAPPGQEIIHSFHLMVIDGNGKMCGYVDGREMDAAQRL
jgi:protein SCO1/2